MARGIWDSFYTCRTGQCCYHFNEIFVIYTKYSIVIQCWKLYLHWWATFCMWHKTIFTPFTPAGLGKLEFPKSWNDFVCQVKCHFYFQHFVSQMINVTLLSPFSLSDLIAIIKIYGILMECCLNLCLSLCLSLLEFK